MSLTWFRSVFGDRSVYADAGSAIETLNSSTLSVEFPGSAQSRSRVHDASHLRCGVESLAQKTHPDSGLHDFDALRTIAGYRGLRDGKHIDFGRYARVVEPGRVRVGDPVVPASA